MAAQRTDGVRLGGSGHQELLSAGQVLACYQSIRRAESARPHCRGAS